MNTYEQKQEARRERYLNAAQKAREASESAQERSRSLLPDNGQPILIGHHSEKRHRNAIKKSDNLMRRACEESDKAKHYAAKADGVGRAGISSDDPEAIDKLKAKIEDAEKFQEVVKVANKIIRSNPRAVSTPAKLAALAECLNKSEEMAAKMFERDCCGQIGFPQYVLTNNNANIRRMKQRLQILEASQGQEHKETEYQVNNGARCWIVGKETALESFKVIENVEENRIQIEFPGKPDAETRSLLKSWGFRWAPSNDAWQRHLNNAGRHAAQYVAGKLTKES